MATNNKLPRVHRGWRPGPHDPRDLTVDSDSIRQLLTRRKRVVTTAAGRTRKKPLPRKVDLREWCPPAYTQGNFNTCSAHVVASLVQYFERRAFGETTPPSRRFLFKVTRNLAAVTGDSTQGVYIRQAMGALKMIGAPPEKFFPYPNVNDPRAAKMFDEEPSAFCYALAADYRAVSYYRLDTPRNSSSAAASATATERRKAKTPKSSSAGNLLQIIKRHLAGAIPMTLGFPLYASAIHASLESGEIAYPDRDDKQVGSHAVVAVGYDDSRLTGTGRGALLVLNSWGVKWGEKGFGWLSYEYVDRHAVSDVWTLIRAEWTDTARFQIDL